MAISVHFQHKGFTADKYGEIEVFDVWESTETLAAFGPAFMPILTGMGVELRPPAVRPIRNVIAG